VPLLCKVILDTAIHLLLEFDGTSNKVKYKSSTDNSANSNVIASDGTVVVLALK